MQLGLGRTATYHLHFMIRLPDSVLRAINCLAAVPIEQGCNMQLVLWTAVP